MLEKQKQLSVLLRGDIHHTAEFPKKFEYIGFIETESENILTCFPGDQICVGHGKKICR